MKVKEVFEKSVLFLKDRNIESPRLETELLLSSVLKTDRIGIYLKYEAPLTEPEVNAMRELVVRKSKGEPTAYLLREKYFYGRRFEVGPGVLIPRPETEQIIEEVLKVLANKEVETSLAIADFGSGSGCLGISLGLEIKDARVYLVEKSSDAFEFIKQNLNTLVGSDDLARFKIFHSPVENWHCSELLDVVVANPPYIDFADPEVCEKVRKYEPPEALFANNEGTALIEAWLFKTIEILKPGGCVFFEIGYKQGQKIKNLFDSTKVFKSVEILQDFNKRDRIIKAVKNG